MLKSKQQDDVIKWVPVNLGVVGWGIQNTDAMSVCYAIESQKHFGEKKDELKVKLARANELALTTDCSTALTSESHITTTCHFITADWEM